MIAIREGKKEDIEETVEILLQIANIHYENRQNKFFKRDKNKIKEWVKNQLNTGEQKLIVAENEKSQICGILMYKIKEIREDRVFKDAKILWISDLGVDEKCRSQGIGKKLMNEAKEIAKEIGCTRIELNCWEFNENARRFYNENGLVTQRRTMEIDV